MTGSVSTGTLRPEDLLQSILDELYRIRPFNEQDLKYEIRAWLEGPRPNDDQASELITSAIDAFNNIAPPGMYFGTLEGDGADFGWWHFDNDDDL